MKKKEAEEQLLKFIGELEEKLSRYDIENSNFMDIDKMMILRETAATPTCIQQTEKKREKEATRPVPSNESEVDSNCDKFQLKDLKPEQKLAVWLSRLYHQGFAKIGVDEMAATLTEWCQANHYTEKEPEVIVNGWKLIEKKWRKSPDEELDEA